MGGAVPAVRISVVNQTPQTIAFAGARSPQQLFSVTVLGPDGTPAKVARGEERMYHPVNDLGGISGHAPIFSGLPPQKDGVIWTWRVGDDFDMSSPGIYRVSLGGRLPYLDTRVCSNTAEIIVAK